MTFGQFFGTAGVAALVAAIVVALINHFGSLQMMRYQYQLAERKKLQNLMGRYTGRMLEAAVDWDHRMATLYDDHAYWQGMSPHSQMPNQENNENSESTKDSQLQAAVRDARRDPDQYLYLSVVFRFLRLLAVARRFEAQAFYINAKESTGHPLEFLCYAKSFLWVMTDSSLSPDDGMPARDHFLNEELRPLLDLCYRDYGGKPSKSRAPQGEPIFDWRRFLTLLEDKNPESRREIEKALGFFYGLRPIEYISYGKTGQEIQKRRRWERLVCLHLLAMSFIMAFGYSWQDVTANRRLALRFLSRDPVVSNAFRIGLKNLGLDHQPEIIQLISDLDKLPENKAYGALDKWEKEYACESRLNNLEDDTPCRKWAREKLHLSQDTELAAGSSCLLLREEDLAT